MNGRSKIAKVGLSLGLIFSYSTATATGMEMSKNYYTVNVDRLEWFGSSQSKLEADASFGDELSRLQYALEVEQEGVSDYVLEHGLGYQTAVSPFFDIDVGVRFDQYGSESIDAEQLWFQIGIVGLLPYFIETNNSLLVSDDGEILLTLEAEYELPLTSRWNLSTRLEIDVATQDEFFEREQGLSSLEFGWRFEYETLSRFSPYVGIEWEKNYFNRESDAKFLIGFRYWY